MAGIPTEIINLRLFVFIRLRIPTFEGITMMLEVLLLNKYSQPLIHIFRT